MIKNNILKVLIAIYLLGTLQCVASFDEAYLLKHGKTPTKYQKEYLDCKSIDRARIGFCASSIVGAGLSGSSGISGVVIDDKDAKTGLLISVIVLSSITLGLQYVCEEKSKEWVEKCSKDF